MGNGALYLSEERSYSMNGRGFWRKLSGSHLGRIHGNILMCFSNNIFYSNDLYGLDCFLYMSVLAIG